MVIQKSLTEKVGSKQRPEENEGVSRNISGKQCLGQRQKSLERPYGRTLLGILEGSEGTTGLGRRI